MKKILLAAVLISWAFAGSSAFAAEKRAAKKKAPPAATTSAPESTDTGGEHKKRKSLHDEFSGQQYGMAGCGLGSIVFGDKPGMVQIFAATLNMTGYQSFAVTSGTSNCDTSSSSHAAAVYIDANKEELKKETARGGGETLAGLSQLMNCSDANLFGQKMQKNYQQLFGVDQNSEVMSELIRREVTTDSELQLVCGKVG